MSESNIKSDKQSLPPAPLEACEACGTEFTCAGKLTGCWCSEIKLSDEMRANLRERYEHCLCRACLERLAQGDSNRDGQDGQDKNHLMSD
jgi:hypothetical protein